MTPDAVALLGLTAIVGALGAALTFVLLRFSFAAAAVRRRRGGAETALLSAALEEAVAKLKAQEQATAARADASERLSGEIIASLSAGLVVVDIEGRVRIVNPAARRMLTLREPTPDADYHQLLGESALSGVIDECMTSGRPISRRPVRLPESRSGVSYLGVSVSPLADQAAKAHGAVCLFTDLTAVKQLEEQLRLKEGLAAVGELTAGIAHEFRNGLATILGYSKLLDPAQLPETYRPYLQGIRSEAESLGEVVTNFLNFARPAELTLCRVDLRAVCERAVEEIGPEIRSLQGDVTVRGEFAPIEGDEVLLRQAFSNLVRNGLEACSGDQVRPTVVIEATLDDRRGFVRIAVDDNGPGIDPKTYEQVFRPFFTSKRHGTGLGLALVQKIIVVHNGRVSVGVSRLGGASVQVLLPTVP